MGFTISNYDRGLAKLAKLGEVEYCEDYMINKDLKQHLNLSEPAWLIVDQDIKNFYLSEKEESKSGFFNIILKNFYETSNASINLRCSNKRDELNKVLSSKTFNSCAGEMKEDFIEKYLEVYKKELKDKALSYPKGHGEKFRVNVENVLLLKDELTEEDYYKDCIGLYLKALYEEYCEKHNYEREQIFFKDKIDEINLAITESKKLKLAIKEKYNPKLKTFYTKRYLVSPYKIVQDDTKSYNYLIGLAEEIKEDGTTKEKMVTSFRISRIDKIKKMSSMGGFISKENKDKIDEELIHKKAQFMLGDIIDVKVRFTRKGLESFKRQLYLRPQFYEKSKEDECVYDFKCTEVQAINYFFKFTRDVEILEPEDLREKFIKRYSEALANYKLDE